MSVLRGFALLTVCMALGLPVASRADDPPADRQATKPDDPEAASNESPATTAAPPKARNAARDAPDAAAKTTKIHLDTAVTDVPADTQANRLMWMHDIIELRMSAADRRKFEAAENGYPSGDDLETFYQSVCSARKISCAMPK
jgi:hypothetical protein